MTSSDITGDELIAVCYHEAGHAVISRCLHVPSGYVEVGLCEDTQTIGRAESAEPWYCEKVWKQQGHDSAISALHAVIVTTMAGAAAEIEFLGTLAGGEDSDAIEVQKLTKGDEQLKAQLWDFTCRIVHRKRNAIRDVAEALLVHRSLEWVDIDALIDHPPMTFAQSR